jgi:hypothetical protein
MLQCGVATATFRKDLFIYNISSTPTIILLPTTDHHRITTLVIKIHDDTLPKLPLTSRFTSSLPFISKVMYTSCSPTERAEINCHVKMEVQLNICVVS